MTAPGINPISEITLPSVRRLSAFINILITRLCRLRLPSWAFLCTGHFFVAQSPAKPRKSKLEIEHQPRPHKVAILRYPFLCWNRTTRYREKKRPFRTSSSSSFSTFQERNQTTSFAESFPLIRKRRNNHHRLSIPHTHTKPTGLPLFGFPGTLFSINPSYFFPFSLQRKDFKSFIKLGQKHPFFPNRKPAVLDSPNDLYLNWFYYLSNRITSTHKPPTLSNQTRGCCVGVGRKNRYPGQRETKETPTHIFFLLTLTRAFFLLVRVCVCVYHFRPAASLCQKMLINLRQVNRRYTYTQCWRRRRRGHPRLYVCVDVSSNKYYRWRGHQAVSSQEDTPV